MRPFSTFLFLCAMFLSYGGLKAAATVPAAADVADSIPGRWQYISENMQTLPVDDRWWQTLGDRTLDSLIALGVERNFNVLAAIHRIEASRQAIRQARAGYYPTVNLSGGWTKTRTSGDMNGIGRATTMSYWNVGADVNWEIDVFGRVKARAAQAKARYRATRAEYAATMVSLCAEIARNYAALRTAQAQLAVARAHIESQDSVRHIAQARFEAELASKLDVEQANTIYYSTIATVPALEAEASTAINAIAMLIGEYPERVAARLSKPGPMPQFDHPVAVGMPAELLRRRPDIIEAECQLAVAAQSIGIAKKEFLPTLSLNGSLGTSAHSAKDLFSNRSLSYTIAPTLSWTLFDGMARKAALAEAREQMKASVDAYNMAILTAVQETDNAMASYNSAMKEAVLLEEVVVHARKAFELSFELYRSGLTSFTNVADAQISYLQYADNLAAAQGNALAALVGLYEALGGGWTEAI